MDLRVRSKVKNVSNLFINIRRFAYTPKLGDKLISLRGVRDREVASKTDKEGIIGLQNLSIFSVTGFRIYEFM